MTQILVTILLAKVTAGEHQITWAPILWAQRDLKLAWNDGFIASDRLFIAMHRFVLTFWLHLGKLWNCRNLGSLKGQMGEQLGMAWVSIPLVYTQLVQLVIILYFICNLFGNQVLSSC